MADEIIDEVVEEQEKTFTQADLDRIVQDRVARENKKFEDLNNELQEFDSILTDFDYSGMSLKEKKEMLRQQAAEYKRQKETQELNSKAENLQTSPEILQAIEELKSKVDKYEREAENNAAEQRRLKEAQEKSTAMINEFTTKYPEINIEELVVHPKFSKFFNASNANLTFTEAYEIYAELFGEVETKTKGESNKQRSTASGKQAGNVGRSFGLTDHQRKLADQNNISYERYAELLPK